MSVTPVLATAIEIQQWIPKSLNEIVGNEELVEHFENGLAVGGVMPNTLITGESRSGKTSGVKAFIRALFCRNRATGSFDACGVCVNCQADVGRYEQTGVFVQATMMESNQKQVRHFLPIDCAKITEAILREELSDLREFSGLRIIYLDEIHRLKQRGMDELLLKPLEELNYVWIASSATVKGLEPMFLNRFLVKLHTQLPTRDALAEWLAYRCKEWGIEWDDPRTLVRLAELSNQNPGKAIQVLARAAGKPSRKITSELVERHRFEEQV